MMGKVVDMFRFPFFTFTWPSWFPFWGGSEFTFFDPVFNFADSCVTVGIVSLLLFCRKELEALGKKEEVTDKKEETPDKKKENLDMKNEEEKA